MQLGIASYHNAEVKVFDIPVAYLNAYLMRIPVYVAKMILQIDPTAQQFVQSDGTLLVKVLRALNGFPESAKLWNEHLISTVVKGGTSISFPVEPCVFRKSVSPTEWSIVTVYVDDCMHIYLGPKVRDKLYAALKDGDLPTPVIQQLSKGHDISYLGIKFSKQCDTEVRTHYVLPVSSPVSHLTQTSFITHSVLYTQSTLSVHLTLLYLIL
jgi:hypothetical protein